jgi:hypothetical protein
MSTNDIDQQVTDHLAYLIRHDECFETIPEIAVQLALRTSQVRGSIKRLVGYGEVRAAGVGANGAKTWTLTNPPVREAS